VKKSKYFASDESETLANNIKTKLSDWRQWISNTGLRENWIKSYRYYYGKHFDLNSSGLTGAGIKSHGSDGELKAVTINHFRNLLRHVLVLTTNQKPAFDCRAINSDLKSLQQARLGNNILDAYLREKRLGQYLKKAAEHALVFGKGFVYVSWEPSSGRPHTTEDYQDEETGETKQKIVYEGDVEISTPSVFDVYMDQTQEDFAKCQWVAIRTYRNKFDLAARYTDKKDAIEGLPTKDDLEGTGSLTFQTLDETSDVPVYHFYHKRSDSMPNGRYMIFCDSDTILYDGPIPYSRLPIFRIVPGEIFGTTEGYSDAFDLIPLQEAISVSDQVYLQINRPSVFREFLYLTGPTSP